MGNILISLSLVFIGSSAIIASYVNINQDQSLEMLNSRLIKLECSQQIIKGTETAGCIGAR